MITLAKNKSFCIFIMIASIMGFITNNLYNEKQAAKNSLNLSIQQFQEIETLVAQVPKTQETVTLQDTDLFSLITNLADKLKLTSYLSSIQPQSSTQQNKESIDLIFKNFTLDQCVKWLEALSTHSSLTIAYLNIVITDKKLIDITMTLNKTLDK